MSEELKTKDLKVAKSLFSLSQEVRDLLTEISERKDNYLYVDDERDSYTGFHRMGQRKVNLYQYGSIPYVDDLETVKKIDAMEISSDMKLLTYFHYVPSMVTLEEVQGLFEEMKEDTAYIYEGVMQRLLEMRGLNPPDYSQRGVLYLFNSLVFHRKEMTETIDLLYRLNKFLGEAGEGESYRDFYQDREPTLFSPDGFPELKKLKFYSHTETLLRAFDEELVGAMGVDINKGTTELLKTLPKKEYTQILEKNEGVNGRKVETVENLLDEVKNPLQEVRSMKEN